MKETILEILWIIKNCLTTFWFWLPVLFAGYFFLQFWMAFYIHPVTLFILPSILSVYLLTQENKRLNAQYGLVKTKILRASHALGMGAEPIRKRWALERSVEEYKSLLNNKQKKRKKHDEAK